MQPTEYSMGTNQIRSRLCRQPQTPSLTKDIDETRFQDWVSNIDWFRPDEIDWVSATSREARQRAESDLNRTSGTEILRHRIPTITKRQQFTTVDGSIFAGDVSD
ncbi:hypothetical protein AUP68_15760 [Ilyonectria robusta]